jgi:hypothetical protein
MKTTVEVSDDLYRRAKSGAALRGRKLKDLVEEGLRLVLETPRESRHHNLAELMKCARGIVDSGITDLASNPEHLKTFGGNASRHRGQHSGSPRINSRGQRHSCGLAWPHGVLRRYSICSKTAKRSRTSSSSSIEDAPAILM